ncbi:MAG: YadA domain protein [Candidatus Peregrinibacteria bacterium GW2011_GWE2_39_6]|nr:MAG: YadA domain protein [Candidatus Peregrinibacteria bacterium GW2011_GWF2_39_17]KKR26693.1 MAG: YadA domain protein [Candidatus Peregrinibacteria bacterium GW2011_GWE2_39_6]HCW32942.1 hypothetical protein [Candidatus Peregrinibacteria bacterium]
MTHPKKYLNSSKILLSLVGIISILSGTIVLAAPTATPPSGEVNPNFSSLYVENQATIEGDLEIGKAVSIGGNLSALGSLNITGDLTIGGESRFTGTATFDGQTQFNKNATFVKQLTVRDNANFEKNLNLTNDLRVDGKSSFLDDVKTNNFRATGNAEFLGETKLHNNVTFNKNAIIDGNLTINGTLNAKQIEGLPTSTGLPDGDITVTGNLSVDENGNFTKNVTIDGDLIVNGEIKNSATPAAPSPTEQTGYFNDDVTIDGQLFVNNQGNFKNVVIGDPSSNIGQIAVYGAGTFSNSVQIMEGLLVQGKNGASSGFENGLTARYQNAGDKNFGIWGYILNDNAKHGAYLGYNDGGVLYDLFTLGSAKVGSLLASGGIFTDIIIPNGHLEIQGGVTAQDFGRFKTYSASINSDTTNLSVTKGCEQQTEILISCSGYSSTKNYQGVKPSNGQCLAQRTNNSGYLDVYAYCFDPTQL